MAARSTGIVRNASGFAKTPPVPRSCRTPPRPSSPNMAPSSFAEEASVHHAADRGSPTSSTFGSFKQHKQQSAGRDFEQEASVYHAAGRGSPTSSTFVSFKQHKQQSGSRDFEEETFVGHASARRSPIKPSSCFTNQHQQPSLRSFEEETPARHAAGRLSPSRCTFAKQRRKPTASQDFEEEARKAARARHQIVEQRRQDARRLDQEARAARRGWSPLKDPQVLQRAEDEIRLAEKRLAAGDSVPHFGSDDECPAAAVKTTMPVVRPPVTDASSASGPTSPKVKASVPLVRPTSPKPICGTPSTPPGRSACTSPSRSTCTSPSKRSAAQSGSHCSSALGPLTWAIERRRSLRMVQRSREAASLTSPPRVRGAGGKQRQRNSQTPPAPVTHLGNRQRSGAKIPSLPEDSLPAWGPLLIPPVPSPSHPIQHFIGSAPCSEADEQDWALETSFDNFLDAGGTKPNDCWSLDAPGDGDNELRDCWPSDVAEDGHTALRDFGSLDATVDRYTGLHDRCSLTLPIDGHSNVSQEVPSEVLHENVHMRAIEDALKKSEQAVQRSLAVRQAMLAKKRSHRSTEDASPRPSSPVLKSESTPVQENKSFTHDSEEVSFCNQTLSPKQDCRSFRLQAWVTQGRVLGGA